MGAERPNDTNARRQDTFEYEEAPEEYFDGDVSGYAFQKPIVEEPKQQPNHLNLNYNGRIQNNHPVNPFVAINQGMLSDDYPETAVDGRRTINKGRSYLSSAPSDLTFELSSGYYATEHHEYPVSHDHKSSKSLGLKDIFEIALTTLAFLSFGMFILQVIMCITMEKTDNNMMVMPMEGSADLDPITEEIRRRRRFILASDAENMNDLARIVLMSIESTYTAQHDGGQCFFRALCENNRHSRAVSDRSKVWIPLWSLGMTWYSARVMTSQPRMNTVLDSLKASILGLGRADCRQLYPRCDIDAGKQVWKRKKRSLNRYKFEWNV